MTRGVPASPDLRMAVIRMRSVGVPYDKIFEWTLVPQRTTQYWVQVFNESGYYGQAPKKKTGRRGKLVQGDIDVSVCC
jgi:hypothetical protein